MISVIIPCYNYGKYVLEAIDSVLASTFQDFEIIVVNDGSTDEYTNNLLKCLNRPKTRVIIQHNQGLSQARNNGINEALGKYFLPLDSDDTIEPTFLEKAYWIMETDEKLGFVYPYVRLFGDENYIWKTMDYNFYDLLWDNQISVCSLVRKKAWHEVGGYNRNMIYGYEDWEFWINLGKHGWFGQNIPEPLFNHRKHGVTMTKTALDKRKFLIEQIKKNHPDIYCTKKLKELKKIWKINRFKINLWIIGKKVVNHKFFSVKFKRFLKDLYLKLRKNRISKKETSIISDFDIIERYESRDQEKIFLLFIVPWLTVGGSEAVLYNLIKKLDNKYQPIIVTTIKDENIWTSKFERITPYIYHFPNLFTENNFGVFISKLIEIYNIKIIHLSNSQLGYDCLKQIKSKNSEIKIIDTIHNHSEDGYLTTSAKNDLYIDVHVAINNTIKNKIIDELKIDENKVKLIYNGVDTAVFNTEKFNKNECLKIFNLPKNKKIIAFIGRLSQEKNPLGFIEIAKEFKNNNDVLFVMAGEGMLFKQAKKAIKRNNLKEKVIMLGNVSKVPELLKCSDILINTSFMEGFSITILEAMAMGVAVVASDIEGNRELIKNEYNGYLAKNNNVSEFVSKINLLIQNNKKNQEIGLNSKDFVLSGFSAEKMGNKYRDLYLFEEKF